MQQEHVLGQGAALTMNNVQTDTANQQHALPLDNVCMGLTVLVGYVRVNIYADLLYFFK